jgi:hypothetical protein
MKQKEDQQTRYSIRDMIKHKTRAPNPQREIRYLIISERTFSPIPGRETRHPSQERVVSLNKDRFGGSVSDLSGKRKKAGE